MAGGTNLPPRKWCGPENFLAHNLGAVKETYTEVQQFHTSLRREKRRKRQIQYIHKES